MLSFRIGKLLWGYAVRFGGRTIWTMNRVLATFNVPFREPLKTTSWPAFSFLPALRKQRSRDSLHGNEHEQTWTGTCLESHSVTLKFFLYLSLHSLSRGQMLYPFFVVLVQSLSNVQLFATPWTVARQASLSFTISQSLLKLTSIESIMPSNHLILCHSLLLLASVFPSIRVFSNESVLHIRSQSIGASASASVLPVNIQDWFPLGLSRFISLLTKGLSRVFCSTRVYKEGNWGLKKLKDLPNIPQKTSNSNPGFLTFSLMFIVWYHDLYSIQTQ